MRVRLVTLSLCTLALAGIVRADDIAAGLWELSLDAQVDAEPGFQPGPLTSSQCLTQADANDPGKLLAPITTAGATGCTYLEKSYVGQTFRFTMQCSGTFQLHTSGEVTFSSTMLHGLITTSSSIDGKKVVFKSTLTGRRLGDC